MGAMGVRAPRERGRPTVTWARRLVEALSEAPADGA